MNIKFGICKSDFKRSYFSLNFTIIWLWTLDIRCKFGKMDQALKTLRVLKNAKNFMKIESYKNRNVQHSEKKNPELLNTIKERKLRYLSHNLRGFKYEIFRLIIKIYGAGLVACP